MSTVTFEIREEGRDYYYRYYQVELDTENYENIDDMRQAAYEMVMDGDIDPGHKEYGDSESDEYEQTEDDYDPDEEYEWNDPDSKDEAAVETPPESRISW
jgi:hypothetical protein